MKPFPFRGLLIYVDMKEEPPGVWWLQGVIEDPTTGETSPVSLPQHYGSERQAVVETVREARLRILNHRWRN